MNIAILIDGAFFLNRYRCIYRDGSINNPGIVADRLHTIAFKHLDEKHSGRPVINELYRIFYYDSYPYTKKQHNPITNKAIDFAKTEQAKFRLQLFEELKRKRKVAMRLGFLKEADGWQIRPSVVKELLNRRISIDSITDKDVFFSLRQKGVDIKIGVDIAALAFKKQVGRIVLISGDCDFVPAAKVARREGIDFILDPMWNPIDPELYEHIDGLRSVCPKPTSATPNNNLNYSRANQDPHKAGTVMETATDF